MNLDFYIFQNINKFAGICPELDLLFIFLAKYLIYVLAASLLLFLAKTEKRRYLRMICFSFLAGIIARFGAVEFIRWLLPRSRPFFENGVKLLVDRINQPAFPSGHAAFSFALSTVVYSYNKKAGIIFFFASFLISIARVFIGVHWPSDILAGAVVGILCGYFVNYLSIKRLTR